jgi:hypothetical protein
LGLASVSEVWTKNFKTSPAEEDDVEMTGDGKDSGESFRDEDDFEKQMSLDNESDKTSVRTSPCQTQVDHLEGWLLETPIPYISNDSFSQEDIFDYWNVQLPGHGQIWRCDRKILYST